MRVTGDDGERLAGGTVGGVAHVPTVLGVDGRRREVLSYLPGRVVEFDTGQADREAVEFGHNDIAPYNVCFEGDDLVGVFDWDFAGPSTPLMEPALIACNCVPLWRDSGAESASAWRPANRNTRSTPSTTCCGEYRRLLPGWGEARAALPDDVLHKLKLRTVEGLR